MTGQSDLYVVTGAGPVGTAVALQLVEAGARVRILTRSGSGPEHPAIERRVVDLNADDGAARLADAAVGAVAFFHCIHAAYDSRAWERELPAAERTVLQVAGERVVVFPESLYSYVRTDAPMTEDDPRSATGGKRGIRARLIRDRLASSTPTVSVVASDFYGPRVQTAHAGVRMIKPVLAGKTLRVLGDPDQPHSFTYVPDLARAMIAASHRPEIWGSVIHAPTAPPVTQRQMAQAYADAAGVAAPKVTSIPSWVLNVVGVASRMTKELIETEYQLTKPFVIDSSRSESLLGLAPTPMEQGVRETLDWYRASAG